MGLNLFLWYVLIGSVMGITSKGVDYLLVFIKPIALTVIAAIFLKIRGIRIICGYPVQKWD